MSGTHIFWKNFLIFPFSFFTKREKRGPERGSEGAPDGVPEGAPEGGPEEGPKGGPVGGSDWGVHVLYRPQKFHIYPQSFAFRPNIQFLDNLSAEGIISRHTSPLKGFIYYLLNKQFS